MSDASDGGPLPGPEITIFPEAPRWHRYDQHDREATAPLRNHLVWVYEEYGIGVTIGYFNGETMVLWTGSTDGSVTHWRRIDPPEPPADPWP